jgi:hypothetical protein
VYDLTRFSIREQLQSEKASVAETKYEPRFVPESHALLIATTSCARSWRLPKITAQGCSLSLRRLRDQPVAALFARGRAGRPQVAASIGLASVDPDHDVGRLDYRISLLAIGQFQPIDGFVCNRGRQQGSADIDPRLRGCRAFLDIDDCAVNLVAR